MEKFQGDVTDGLRRIERKIDDNMESTMGRYEGIDRRVQSLENDNDAQRRAMQAVEKAMRSEREGGMETWQKWGIALGAALALFTIFLAVCAIIATVLIAVL